jgi:hypothetical protein
MNDTYVELFVREFLKHDIAVAGIDHATTEAVCVVIDAIARNTDLKYGDDYQFHSSFFDGQGQRKVKFWFRDETKAFMLKLMGFTVDG